MSSLVINTPARVDLVDFSKSELELARSFLTYHDKSVDFLIQKHKRNRSWMCRDEAGWQEHLLRLKEQQKACILFESETVGPYTYSGLAQELSKHLGGVQILNRIQYPDPKSVAWDRVPEHPARPFQKEIEQTLIQNRHGAVEVGTGLGKSRSAMDICHDLGLRTVIMVPSRNIAHQMYREFSRHLGQRNVGLYGDGKKQLGKKFTIGIGASLTKVEPGSEAWKWFNGADILIADESHLCPAVTLEKVCMQLLAPAPYRFFFSGTQTRMDGSELVLKGITGEIVYTKTVKEGVDEGWLARPMFKMVRVHSKSIYHSDDVQKLARIHLLENPDILDRAADLANKAVKLLGHQVLILIDELNQYNLLAPRLKFPVRFAHGQDNTAEAKRVLPRDCWRSDPTDLVDQFNRREFPILVGTSCISTGTDIQPVETCIYLMGGKSDIGVPQAVGRCTRRCDRPDGTRKSACNVVDFAPMIHSEHYDDGNKEGKMSPIFRHAMMRSKIYEGIYGPVVWM